MPEPRTESNSTLRVAWSPWAALLIAAGIVHLVIASHGLHHGDFDMIYASAVALRDGLPAYLPVHAIDGVWRNMNPPQLNLFTWPLARLPLGQAARTFQLLNLAALMAAVWIVVPPRVLLSRRGGWVLAATLAQPALVMQVGVGQVAGLLALLACGAWRALVGGRWLLGGVLLGVLCGLKPIFGPIVFWLFLARHWKAAMASVGSAACLALAAVLVWGVAPQRDWLDAVRSVTWFDSRFNMSWVAFLSRVWPAAGSYVAAVCGAALVGAGAALMMARTPAGTAVNALLAVSLLAGPLGWLYYLCVPGPLLMRWALERGRWPALAWLLWIPLPLLPATQTPIWERTTLESAYFWGLIGLTASLLFDSRLSSSGRVRGQEPRRHRDDIAMPDYRSVAAATPDERP